MQIKILVRLFIFILAVNFSLQVVLSTSHIGMAQIEVDGEMDSEKKESKSESETDKFNHSHLLSKFETQRENCLLALHYNHWWISPTIEMSSPPPELV